MKKNPGGTLKTSNCKRNPERKSKRNSENSIEEISKKNFCIHFYKKKPEQNRWEASPKTIKRNSWKLHYGNISEMNPARNPLEDKSNPVRNSCKTEQEANGSIYVKISGCKIERTGVSQEKNLTSL